MTRQQLEAVADAPAKLAAVQGRATVTSALGAARIQVLVSRAAPLAVFAVDPAGLDAAQLQALQATGTVVVHADGSAEVGGELSVGIDVSALTAGAVGAQLRIGYDATRLAFAGADAGADMPVLVTAVDDGSSVRVSTAVAPGGNGSSPVTSGNVARIRFRALVPFCGATDCVTMAAGDAGNVLATGGAATVPFAGVVFTRASALDAPVFAGVPADVTLPADAGTAAGAYVPQPTVTASNGCGARTVTLSIALPGGVTATAWPAAFPVGTSTVTWNAAGAGGAAHTASAHVTVLDHQVASLHVRLVGTIVGPTAGFDQELRVGFPSGQFTTATVHFSATGVGVPTDVEVPVAAGYPCISVKDPAHTLAAAGMAPVIGAIYVPANDLIGGEANDDNMVDILDFGIFVGDRGGGKLPGDRSNWNRDGVVGSADFTFISLQFLSQGGSCVGSFTGGRPRDRVSIKELRRLGLGDLAVADFNHDGWLDRADILLYAQGAETRPATPWDRPSEE
jgi:hypothetical protein